MAQNLQFRNPHETIEDLERKLEQANQTIEDLQIKLEQANREVKALRAFVRWEDKLFSTPSEIVSDAQKISGRFLPGMVKRAIARATTDDLRDNGNVRVYRDELAHLTGKSADRAGATLKSLSEIGAIQREVVSGYDKGKGRNDNALFIGLTPALQNVDFPNASPRNRGNNQKHFICKECHSTRTIARKLVEVTCQDCGTVNHYDLSKKEDQAFLVDAPTAENFEAWYGEIEIEEAEEAINETLEQGQDSSDCLAPASDESGPAAPTSPTIPTPTLEHVSDCQGQANGGYAPTLPFIKRPWACHCGLRMYWREVGGIAHCIECEIEYRGLR